jgi:hypothetical protein
MDDVHLPDALEAEAPPGDVPCDGGACEATTEAVTESVAEAPAAVDEAAVPT